MLLIIDMFIVKVFWVLATAGSPCLILSLIGTFSLIGSKNWKLIFLYLFFVFSLIPHLIVVFYMRKYFKSCKKVARQDAENQKLENERKQQESELEQEKLRNQMELENREEQVMRLLERQDVERGLLQEQLGHWSATRSSALLQAILDKGDTCSKNGWILATDVNSANLPRHGQASFNSNIPLRLSANERTCALHGRCCRDTSNSACRWRLFMCVRTKESVGNMDDNESATEKDDNLSVRTEESVGNVVHIERGIEGFI
ncbi:unnamed protein product [Caenorhabditis sp. 36 PRJEB53466]|nr:unnamed protein product [Caenorhabditis sp. 36 PRJEB53466]